MFCSALKADKTHLTRLFTMIAPVTELPHQSRTIHVISKMEPAETLRQRSSLVSKFSWSKGKEHAKIRSHVVTLFQIHSCLKAQFTELFCCWHFFGPLQVQYRKRRALASSTTQAKPSLRFSPVMALHRRMFHRCVRISSSRRAW